METPLWRLMRPEDLPAITAIADEVHGDYTETQETYAERLALNPSGCFVLADGARLIGLLVTHPWYRASPPALNARLGALPDPADIYYLHDVALLPDARGTGAGKAALALTIEAARSAGLAEVHLMAVNGADRFWRANGFADLPISAEKQAAYGGEARYMGRTVI